MARRTRYVGVSVGQQESGEGVVEIRAVPALGGVTVSAVGDREDRPGTGMRRIIRLLPGG